MYSVEVVQDYLTRVGRKEFIGSDVLCSLELWAIAEEYTEDYEGDSSFMNNIKSQSRFRRITSNQAAVALNILVQSLEPAIVRDSFEPDENRVLVIPNGYYTLEHEDGSYTTVRLIDYKDKPGVQKFGYLVGSDNMRDYLNVGSVSGSTLHLWSRVESAPNLPTYFQRLLDAAQDTTLEGMGRLYAMRSGNCWMCGKPLTTPESKADLVGPICKAKMG